MSLRQYVWAIDPIGSVLFVSSATLMLLALDWAGGAYVSRAFRYTLIRRLTHVTGLEQSSRRCTSWNWLGSDDSFRPIRVERA